MRKETYISEERPEFKDLVEIYKESELLSRMIANLVDEDCCDKLQRHSDIVSQAKHLFDLVNRRFTYKE